MGLYFRFLLCLDSREELQRMFGLQLPGERFGLQMFKKICQFSPTDIDFSGHNWRISFGTHKCRISYRRRVGNCRKVLQGQEKVPSNKYILFDFN